MKKSETQRTIHDDFLYYLQLKDSNLISLYAELRQLIISMYPDCNEMLYHTHALTSVYTISERLADGFCHIPIYAHHLNLGFNKGALLDDVDNLLQGTGKLIRHIPIKTSKDFKNQKTKSLIKKAIKFALADMDKEPKIIGQAISKIKPR